MENDRDPEPKKHVVGNKRAPVRPVPMPFHHFPTLPLWGAPLHFWEPHFVFCCRHPPRSIEIRVQSAKLQFKAPHPVRTLSYNRFVDWSGPFGRMSPLIHHDSWWDCCKLTNWCKFPSRFFLPSPLPGGFEIKLKEKEHPFNQHLPPQKQCGVEPPCIYWDPNSRLGPPGHR